MNFFRYDTYRLFLAQAREMSSFVSFADPLPERGILLRHDIDIDLNAAVELAAIEQEAGVKATYFVLMTGYGYNPQSSMCRGLLKRLVKMGMDIGLHFDPTVYGEASDETLGRHARQEADQLAAICGKEITATSLHNPSLLGHNPIFAGFINTYDPALFENAGYLSDSRMNFRGSNPFDAVSDSKQRLVQMLLHPMHYSEQGTGYVEAMKRHFAYHSDFTESRFRVNSSFDADLGPANLWDAICGQKDNS